MHILIVEDHPEIATNIAEYLELQGHTTTIINDGQQALDHRSESRPDIIVLDVMLPHADGFSIASHIRQSSTTPILFLTARGELDDKIQGFDLGGDDYLVKPFALQELVARIGAIAQRVKKEETITLGDLHIVVSHHQVFRKGKELSLTPQEFTLLKTLVVFRPHIVSRTDLIEAIRG